MKKLLTLAAIPLLTGMIWAQADQQQTETRTTTTTTKTSNWNGTLVDAGCYTHQTANRETKDVTHPDENTTKTETTKTVTETTECPVTTTTTTFGLLTPDGKYVRFDEPSNTRIIEVAKNNKKWHTFMEEKKPVQVRVVGTSNGELIVVKTIQ
jgi:cytoskeletal protein RodZ